MFEALASVVVVNWNGKHLLEECIDSLLAQTYSPVEVILVDNGSKDGSGEWVRGRYGDKVRLVELAQNLGFAGGNNAGFDAAQGEFILMLNNDAVADPRWVEELVRVAQTDPKIGGCSSKILLHQERDLFENTGLLMYPDGSARGRARLERDEGQYETMTDIPAPSGCACLYRRAAIDQAEGFDPAFFCYGDDVELGLKCLVAGWRFVYVPKAVAWHKESQTSGKYSPMKAFLVERNRLWVMIKTYPAGALLASPWHTARRYWWNVKALWQGEGTAGRFRKESGAGSLVWILLKAYGSALMQLGRLLKERRRIQSMRPPGEHPLKPWLGKKALSAREFTMIA
ncbi:glycosyltransferase family 2 protein [bacterium]|nr:glycosyltransferase family 2 protein [bacterium]